jgi:hypothetical protein
MDGQGLGFMVDENLNLGTWNELHLMRFPTFRT